MQMQVAWGALLASPVSNDGRGLKRLGASGKVWVWKASPVSNDGRGLKRDRGFCGLCGQRCFARQQ